MVFFYSFLSNCFKIKDISFPRKLFSAESCFCILLAEGQGTAQSTGNYSRVAISHWEIPCLNSKTLASWAYPNEGNDQNKKLFIRHTFLARFLQQEPQQWTSTTDLTYLSPCAPQPELPTRIMIFWDRNCKTTSRLFLCGQKENWVHAKLFQSRCFP